MSGELDSVYMTKKKGRQPIYFTAYHTSETESLYIESTFVVITDKTYKTDTNGCIYLYIFYLRISTIPPLYS